MSNAETYNDIIELVDGDEVIATVTLAPGSLRSIPRDERITSGGSRRVTAGDFFDLAGGAKSFDQLRQRGQRSASSLREEDAVARDSFAKQVQSLGGRNAVKRLIDEVRGNKELLQRPLRSGDHYYNPNQRAREREKQLADLNKLMQRGDFSNF